MTVLSVSKLCKAYGGVQAVCEVSFSLASGELLALIGPNGAGKTTCFNLLNGQIAADSGSAEFEGASLIGRKPRQIWRMGVGRTFQITATFSSMSVRENVQTALLNFHGKLNSLVSLAAYQYRDEAMQLLTRVGIAAQADRPCAVLAYGDLKRVELAIALANRPRLLLMDEPTAGMAPTERVALMQLTAELARASGIAVLFTEHDMDVVFAHADRILVLNHGRLIAEGKPADVRANRKVQEVYLGSGAVYGGAHA
ncbi:MAG: ABC transporter ATP-binding protein [Betaproteobacteria bacterium]|nr:MAG: ABC transporter ATP-binding protein [Betaproteobacteria bacterium]